MHKPEICAIAAISSDKRAIGFKNQLLWHLPADLKRFKELTLGYPIIMGRKTYDSIVNYLGKPLPGRTSIVLTRSEMIAADNVIVVSSIDEAITKANELGSDKIFIGGGTSIYELALPYTDTLYLTLVTDEPEADSFFPEYNSQFDLIESNLFDHTPGYAFAEFRRKNNKKAAA